MLLQDSNFKYVYLCSLKLILTEKGGVANNVVV